VTDHPPETPDRFTSSAGTLRNSLPGEAREDFPTFATFADIADIQRTHPRSTQLTQVFPTIVTAID
jgi:hypothetical protein